MLTLASTHADWLLSTHLLQLPLLEADLCLGVPLPPVHTAINAPMQGGDSPVLPEEHIGPALHSPGSAAQHSSHSTHTALIIFYTPGCSKPSAVLSHTAEGRSEDVLFAQTCPLIS